MSDTNQLTDEARFGHEPVISNYKVLVFSCRMPAVVVVTLCRVTPYRKTSQYRIPLINCGLISHNTISNSIAIWKGASLPVVTMIQDRIAIFHNPTLKSVGILKGAI